ncbi:hypothetical protein [Kitasatospora sp. NPDC090091]|uniref:hypothetical protein n=1 Tax=Kitasatospora sp. NPDC090091 TaxID=3364081 RepID=UPI00382CA31A
MTTTGRPPWPQPVATALRGSAAVLHETLADICRTAAGARWHPGAEYEIWRLAHDRDAAWGPARAADLQPPLLLARTLATQAGHWLTAEDGHLIPIPLPRWCSRYRSWENARRLGRSTTP